MERYLSESNDMINILVSADWHINLHAKKVPKNWQINRFRLLFNNLFELEKSIDIHIVAGDIFDKKPQEDEVCLFLEWAHKVTKLTYIITGNHDATKRGESFLESFKNEKVINNSLVKIITINERVLFQNQGFQFFPYGNVQTDQLPSYHEGDILVTHIRGEVLPHITPEYDFEKLKQWKLILLGDLHFNHQYKQYPAYYPGSPMNVVFDRDENREYGVNLINFESINKYEVQFLPLKLPKLIRRTIKVGEKMITDGFNHIVYELTGSVDELAKVEKNDLLDKKLVYETQEKSKLDLSGNLSDELKAWLNFMKIEDTQSIMDEFTELKIS